MCPSHCVCNSNKARSQRLGREESKEARTWGTKQKKGVTHGPLSDTHTGVGRVKFCSKSCPAKVHVAHGTLSQAMKSSEYKQPRTHSPGLGRCESSGHSFLCPCLPDAPAWSPSSHLNLMPTAFQPPCEVPGTARWTCQELGERQWGQEGRCDSGRPGKML